MSAGIQAMQWAKAKDIAVALCYRLNPFCDRLHIAGSIRRKKEWVKDIEIVAQPKEVFAQDLFGEFHQPVRNEGFMQTAMTFGNVVKGKPSGRYMQIELPDGIMLDLFMPQQHDYYRQYAIRTGSANYSSLLIATAWKRLGWCGTSEGLRKIHECEEKKLPDGKSKWVCKKENPSLPPSWESEESFFNWLQIPYLTPEKRNL